MQKINVRRKFWAATTGMALSGTAAFLIISACTQQATAAKPTVVSKNPPSPGAMAKINGEIITEDALIGDDKMDFLEIKKREYDLRNERLTKLMIEKLVGAEAKKSGLSTEEFINKKIVKGEAKISDKEFKKFVAEKQIPESQLNPQIRERINAFLLAQKREEAVQAYLAKLTKDNPVERYFSMPKSDVRVDFAAAPLIGKDDAPIMIVEFSDFQCPYCSRGAKTLAEIKKKYGSKVRVAFKNFPLSFHQNARPAAEAGLCVNEQGADKFWKFHDVAFQNQDKLDTANLEKYAKESGANVDKFKECFSSKKFASVVQKDIEYGEKLGVKSTPTFIVGTKSGPTSLANGTIINGAVPVESFSETVDQTIENSGSKNM